MGKAQLHSKEIGLYTIKKFTCFLRAHQAVSTIFLARLLKELQVCNQRETKRKFRLKKRKTQSQSSRLLPRTVCSQQKQIWFHGFVRRLQHSGTDKSSHIWTIWLWSNVCFKREKMWSYKSPIGDQSPRIFLHVKHTKSLSLLSCHPSMLADKRSIIRRPKWGCLKSIWPEGMSLKTWPSF